LLPIFSHVSVAIDDLLHPGEHGADQVLQEVALGWLEMCDNFSFLENNARHRVLVVGG